MAADYFRNRSTKRNFADKEISQSLLREIIERALHAPTCGNMQLYSVIITRESENRKIIANKHFNQPAAVKAPVILTICADFNRFSRWCELKGAKPGYDNFHSFIVAITDAIILAQQITTIAEMEGLGTCYLGTVNYNAEEISELLNLPDLVVPIASLAMGYAEEEEEKAERLPFEATVFWEKYPELTDDEILDLYREKEDYPLNKEFVKINDKPTLAHIFTEIRYPEDMNLKVSDTFVSLLKKKSFLK